jgi:NAD(P)H-flavin reductase
MLAKKTKSRVVAIQAHGSSVYTISFESLSRTFKYYPGQFLHLALDESYDGAGEWPESRCFSMRSNPEESLLRITYSVKGGFTGRMEEQLKVGQEVWLKLPYGSLFTQPHDKQKTVFIAGGTGVTPFLSLFTHSSFAEYENPRIYLGFRSKEFNVYHDELKQMFENRVNKDDIQLNIAYENESGLLNMEQIIKENDSTAPYFISGPPQMIKIFKNSLLKNDIAQECILTDEWE